MAFEEWSHLGGFWVTSVVTLPKGISIIFTADIFFDTTLFQSAPLKSHINAARVTCITFLCFSFLLTHFEGLWDFQVVCQGRESLMHGNTELSVFWRQAEIRQRYGSCTGSNLKQIPLGGGVGGVKKVKERRKGGVEVARKGNIVNPLSVWRCLFLSFFLSSTPPTPPPQ